MLATAGRVHLGRNRTFRKMVVCGPQNEKDWWYVGHLYQNPRQYKDTIPAFENATKINPQDELAWWFLGYAYGNIGDRAKVSDVYEHLKLTNQNDANILFYMWLAPRPQ